MATFFALLVVLGLLRMLFIVWTGDQQLRWPTVEGHVVVSQVDTEQSQDGVAGGTVYRPDVQYTYTLNGETFTKELVPHRYTSFSGPTQQLVEHHPVGQPVTVFYSPRNPAEATLKPGVRWGKVIVWALLTVLVGALALLL